MVLRLGKAGFYLTAFNLLALVSLGQTAEPSKPLAPIVAVPDCPVAGYSRAAGAPLTKELRIRYYPSSPGAFLKNPTALTLRLAFNGPEFSHNLRTIPLEKANDGSWQAIVPLGPPWEFAIWYVRDDTTGRRDDNHGEYWDLAFCGADGKKTTEGIRYQARSYTGSILAEDIKRNVDDRRAISIIESDRPDSGYALLGEEWYFKYLLHREAESADSALAAEISDGLAQHATDPTYVRETASFLARFEPAFPAALVEHAAELADRIVPGSQMKAYLEKERAESLKDPRQQANALGEWLIKYPDDRSYDQELRKERLDLFDRLMDIKSAEESFQDLVKRYPDDADLYVTMASIYVRRRAHLDRALELLDNAGKHLGSGPESTGGFSITLTGDMTGNGSENEAILNFWRGRALAEQTKWSDAEGFLAQSARVLDDPETYALLASVQEQQQELIKAKDSYLEAAIRESPHEQKNVEKFVALSLKTGTPNRKAALRELAAARKRNFDAEHYQPQLIDLPVPDFTFSAEGGAKITAASLRGKIVVLDLWATWCGGCISELGGFDTFRQLHPEVVVVPVAEESNFAAVRRVFRAQELRFDHIVATGEQGATKFGLGVPQTYVIDGNGRIRIAHYGGLPDVVTYLESDLRALAVSRAEQGPVADWEKTLIAALPHLHYVFEPGTRFSYSNIGYATLGAALARAAGQPYLEYVPAHIFEPLGMTHSALQLNPEITSHLSKGYVVEKDKIDAETAQREQSGRGYKVPNGAIYTTVGDLARFSSFLMGNGPESVLRTASLEHYLEQVIVPSNSELTQGYGLGFMVERRDNYIAFGHGGDVAGYQAALYMNRDAELGLIVLANAVGPGSVNTDDLALRSLDLLTK